MVVAIDGPAGAGKSSVARAVARGSASPTSTPGRCTGRVALAAAAAQAGRRPQVAAELQIELGDRVLVDGDDVTEAIRAPEVSEAASRAAADPRVRAAMVAQQRRLLGDGDWVAEGRDIGTVVAPEAEVKVFLTASAARRARRRRAAELGADPADRPGRAGDPRPARHQPRALAADPAPDAVVLDTTGLTLDEVVERIARAGALARAGPRLGALASADMKVAIVGYPNVGKSSLVNRLTRVARGGRARTPRGDPRPQGAHDRLERAAR